MRKIIFVGLVFLALFSSCNTGPGYIYVRSSLPIDSIVLIANGKKTSTGKIEPDKTDTVVLDYRKINSRHHLELIPVIYYGDTHLRGEIYYNDILTQYDDFNMSIDSQMKVTWDMATQYKQ